jgi:hypothetical protein
MSRTQPAPQDTPGDSRIGDDRDLAGPDGGDATDDGTRRGRRRPGRGDIVLI